MCGQIFIKVPSHIHHGSRADTCAQTDGHDEANGAFEDCARAPQLQLDG
jgi:hypothetical protein